jgi:putative oxidoreductase
MVFVSMSVAYLAGDFEALTSIFSNSDKFVKADPFPFLLVALIVLVFGPGLFSIDALLKRWLGPRSDSSAERLSRQTDKES